MSNRIHVLINGEQFGPYPEAEFRQHVAERKILKSDLVWREGLPDWLPSSELIAILHAEQSVSAVLPPTAKSLFETTKASAEGGDPEAQFKLGLMHDKGDGAPLNRVEAARWWRKAVEQQHARAQFQLSLALETGQGVVANEAESLQWLHAAAEGGLAGASP